MDEWKLLQLDVIPDTWSKNDDGSPKRLDHYWSKIFSMESSTGGVKYKLLCIVVKSCLCLQHGNASVERSLSDNKNTLTVTRSNLGDETLMGLRRAKEYARASQGAHNVVVTKEMVSAVQHSHRLFMKRKEEENIEKRLGEQRQRQKAEEEKKEKERLEKVEKTKDCLEKKENKLEDDEKRAGEQLDIVERSLSDATASMKVAIATGDILGVSVASDMVESAIKRLGNAKMHRENQVKQRKKIGKRRESMMNVLLGNAKKVKNM
jgi:hypothetical protein